MVERPHAQGWILVSNNSQRSDRVPGMSVEIWVHPCFIDRRRYLALQS